MKGFFGVFFIDLFGFLLTVERILGILGCRINKSYDLFMDHLTREFVGDKIVFY